jgi:hypothetical protein
MQVLDQSAAAGTVHLPACRSGQKIVGSVLMENCVSLNSKLPASRITYHGFWQCQLDRLRSEYAWIDLRGNCAIQRVGSEIRSIGPA